MDDKQILELSDDDLDQVSGGMRVAGGSSLSPDSTGIIPEDSFTPREYIPKSFEEAKREVSNGYGQPTGGWNTVRDPII